MGRPTMTRSIKRNRLRALDLRTDCPGQVSPAALQHMAECGVTEPKSQVAEPKPKRKKTSAAKKAARPSKCKRA